ncbi:MAG: MBL fold metallo-hydrolase [Anaerolineales bacterium]
MEITPNVHIISGTAVNCYLIVEPDGLTMIDTGLPSYEKKITGYIAALGRSVQDIKQILITHADGDHVGSLAALKAASGAAACANAIEAKAIRAGESSRDVEFTGLVKIIAGLLKRFFEYQAVEIDQILAPGQELPTLGGLAVIPTPGHTPGHISFYAPSAGILFAGDSMRASKDALIPSRGGNTWDEAEALSSVRLQAAMNPKIVCVGHGPVIRDAAGKFPQG